MRTQPFHAILLCAGLVACSDADATAPVAGNTLLGWAFPDEVRLPDGFWPEGIAFGRGTTFYVGSLATGALYRADALTGRGRILAPGEPGLELVGMKYDPAFDRLYVAAGFTGQALVYDGTTGERLAAYALAEPGSALINDVVLLSDAVYFTDSFNQVLHRLPRSSSGVLPAADAAVVIPISGDFLTVDSPIGNANGIVAAPDGQHLIVVNTSTGLLYSIHRTTGESTLIPIGNGSISGDGLLLQGHVLYVVQGHLNEITMVSLSPDLANGTIVGALTHPALKFPSTIARFGDAIYAVNARFDVVPEDTTTYSVVRLRR